MKTFIKILILSILSLNLVVAQTIYMKVQAKDTTTHAPGSYVTPTQLDAKVSLSDTVNKDPGYVTQTMWSKAPVYFSMAADTTNPTRLTPKVIGGLETNLLASATYEFGASIQFTANNVGNGLVLIWSFPGSPTSFSSTFLIPVAANGTSALYTGQQTATTDTVITTAVGSASAVYTAIITGKIVNASTPGTLRLWFKGTTMQYTVTIKAGSSMWVRRVS